MFSRPLRLWPDWYVKKLFQIELLSLALFINLFLQIKKTNYYEIIYLDKNFDHIISFLLILQFCWHYFFATYGERSFISFVYLVSVYMFQLVLCLFIFLVMCVMVVLPFSVRQWCVVLQNFMNFMGVSKNCLFAYDMSVLCTLRMSKRGLLYAINVSEMSLVLYGCLKDVFCMLWMSQRCLLYVMDVSELSFVCYESE